MQGRTLKIKSRQLPLRPPAPLARPPSRLECLQRQRFRLPGQILSLWIEVHVDGVTAWRVRPRAVVVEDVDVVDGWNRDAVEREIDPGSTVGEILLADDVLDEDQRVVHRWIQAPLDGIQIRTPLTSGTFQVNLINGARIEQLPNQPIDVRSYPRLHHDTNLDGGLRVSFVLLDVDVEGLERNTDVSLDVESRGAITFFDHEARNLRLMAEFTGLDNPESRYLRHWTDAYDLHRATGDSSEYVGFGPNGRLSGAEGMTIHPASSEFHLDVILQQVVVQ